MVQINSKGVLRQIFGLIMSYMYQYEVTKKKNTDLYAFYKGLYLNFTEKNYLPKDLLDFAQRVIDYTKSNTEHIDGIFSVYLDKVNAQKTSVVDYTILRVGTSLILYYFEEINPISVINVAIETSKKYSGENSYKFINAVLDKVYKRHCPMAKHQDLQNRMSNKNNDLASNDSISSEPDSTLTTN